MLTCKRCGCYCDPGDTVNGICEDCIEEENQLEIRREWNRKMLARNVVEQIDGQLVLNY